MDATTKDSRPSAQTMHHEDPKVDATIEDVAADFLAKTEAAMEAERRLADHQADATLEALGEDVNETSSLADEARARLVEAIIRADGSPIPDDEEWCESSSVLWKVRSGGKLYGVVRSKNSDIPKTLEEAAKGVSVFIEDLQGSTAGQDDPAEDDEDDDDDEEVEDEDEDDEEVEDRPRSRPGTRYFLVNTGDDEGFVYKGREWNPEKIIASETELYQICRASDIRVGGTAEASAAAYADRTVWQGDKLVMFLQPQVDGSLKVTRIEGLESIVSSSQPDEREYEVLPPLPEPEPLTKKEHTILDMARAIGLERAMDRMLLCGHYGVILDVINRMGTDAVGELRRLIAAGKIAS